MHFINTFEKFSNLISLQYKNKFKTFENRIFKIITLFISLCGLIYQVQIIYERFIAGKTVINLEIGRLSNASLPAITICFTNIYSMERMAKEVCPKNC